MSDVRLESFDPLSASEGHWLAYLKHRRQRHADDNTGDPILSDEDWVRAMKTEGPLRQGFWWSLWLGDEMIADMSLTVRKSGTPDYAEHEPHVDAWIGVLAKFQRQGYGHRMLVALSLFMVEHGKTILSMNARTPAGHRFLRSTGAQEKFLNMKNRLTLDTVDWNLMAQWSQAPAVKERQLQWEVHLGRTPFQRWEQLIDPMTCLLNQAPWGELNAPPIRYEMQQIRHWYEQLDRNAGEHYMVILKQGDAYDAPIIAVSNGEWDARNPEWVGQYLTAVDPQWRGLGLAKAVKARMLEIVRDHQPAAKWVGTYNAHSNAPMLVTDARVEPARHKAFVAAEIAK
jgi:GNAT superfamily N-acetyltransferase